MSTEDLSIIEQIGQDIERYGEIDLAYFYEKMSPQMFKAFTENIGVIRGSKDLDICKLTQPSYQS